MREATGPGAASVTAQLRRTCARDDATHYEVLCVPRHATRQAVKESYHLLMALIHPDRQDAAGESWPTECAQRVNRAYAVLGDERARSAYDATLRAPEGAARPARRGRRRDHFVVRFAKVSLAVLVVLATLLVLEMGVSDFSGGSSVLHAALRGARARDAAAASEGPRFIGRTALRAPIMDTEPLPPAKTLAAMTMPWPFPASAAAASPLPAAIEAPMMQPSTVPRMAALAQVSLPAPHVESRIASREIEDLVVRVIGYYEAGEADKLMALLDAKDAGYWKTQRMRQAYADFFVATRSRRLRVDSLVWQTASDSARAHGMATVSAEYFDAPGVKERQVEVEMDIAFRDGRAVITRLALFPNTP